MAEIEKLLFYDFLFIYKSWENYPRCILVLVTYPNQNPTWSCSTFQHKPIKTDSGHFEYMIKPPLKILGKFSNKFQRWTLTYPICLSSYLISSCSKFPFYPNKTNYGHFEFVIKPWPKILGKLSNKFLKYTMTIWS